MEKISRRDKITNDHVLKRVNEIWQQKQMDRSRAKA